MSLFDTISEDIKKAMLAREKDKLEALRAIKAALLLARTEPGHQSVMSEEAEILVVRKLIKQRKESAEIYQQQNRMDLADKERAEATFMEPYLPAQMSEEELGKALSAIITAVGAGSMSDLGKVMGVATRQLAGKADGAAIARKVKELLSK